VTYYLILADEIPSVKNRYSKVGFPPGNLSLALGWYSDSALIFNERLSIGGKFSFQTKIQIQNLEDRFGLSLKLQVSLG